MKRIIFLTALLPLFISSYSQYNANGLTDEQEASIEEEVRVQLDKHLVSLRTLDYELWLGFISKDNFIPGYSQGVIGIYLDYDRYVGAVKESFKRRIRQNFESMKVKITPLSSDLAILTFTGLFENWYKGEEYRRDFINATVLWKKEKDGWKIIYTNENWIPSD